MTAIRTGASACRWKRSFWAASFAWLTVLTVLAVPALAAGPKPLFDYRRTVLDNGLEVITLEDFSCPIVAVQVWYRVGSKDEKPDRRGFAHMFEHMMFRGTDRLGPTDHFDLVRRTGGSCNGFTSFDQTAYVEALPANQLDLALWLEAERMSFLKIDQDSFDTERRVVEEERRLSTNQPYGTAFEKVLAELYKRHPYRWPPIGNIADLRASSVQDLRQWWKTYYTPANATLVIVGSVKHAEALDLARKYLGWIPKYPAPPRVDVREPLPAEAREVTIRERVAPMPAVRLIYRSVRAGHDDEPALDMLSIVLGSGRSSRLYRDLVATRQLAASAYAGNYALQDDGMFTVGATTLAGGDPAKAIKAMSEQVDRLRSEKVSAVELLKARNQMLRGVVTEGQSIAGKASLLARTAVRDGDVSRVNSELDRIRRVSEDDLLRVAKEYLAPERVLRVTIEGSGTSAPAGTMPATAGGGGAEEVAPVSAAREQVAPPSGREGAKRPADYPTTAPVHTMTGIKVKTDFTSRTLDNGLKVLVVTNKSLPFVTVQLGLSAGQWTEDRVGSADLAIDMLLKGSAAHTEAQLAEELDTYAISLGGGAGTDTAAVNASCLTEHLDRAMGLLGEVVLSPTFPKDEFDKLLRRKLSELAIAAANPSGTASREYCRLLWGRHPYSRSAGIEASDLDGITVDDLKRWWTTFARPDMAVLIFAGDVEPDKAVELARKALGSWQAKGPKPQVKLPEIPVPPATRIYIVDRPGATQSQIRVGQLGITRKAPSYFTAPVMTEYFGGAFGSRLGKSVRVEKGLTYGIWGGNFPKRMAGEFTVQTFTKTEAAARAVQAIIDELRRLRTESPTKDELETTRSHIIGRFPMQRETPQGVARDLWLMESEGLPADYYEKYLDAVGVVSAEDCRKLAEQIVDPGRLIILVLGDAGKMKDELGKIAPVTVLRAKD
jgi:zinc protease